MAQRLTDIDVDEISLVRKGANRRPFTLLKADEDMKPDKIIKEIEALNAEDREAVLAKFAKTDEDEGVDAILKALEGQNDGKAEAIKTELAKAAAQVEEVKKANEKLAADLAKERETREVRDYVQLAKSYERIPGVNPDDFGPILRKAESALSDEERKKFREVMKAANEGIPDSLLKELGTDDDSEGTAASQIEKLAQEVRKADPKLTPHQARTQVMKSHPDLANRALEEEDERKERR